MATLQDIVNQSTGGKDAPMSYNVQGPIQPLASEPSLISSSQGASVVENTNSQLNDLAAKSSTQMPVETTTPTDTTKTETGSLSIGKDETTPAAPEPTTTTEDYVTYINPKTGAEKTLRGDAISDAARKSLENGGFEILEESTSKGTDNAKTSNDLKSAQTELDSAIRDLQDSVINDRELRQTISQITKRYSARMRQMEDVNRRREQTLSTLGIRLGSRYTGGSSGVFGGILAEEERQGIERVTVLENEMNSAIESAKKAAKEHNFSVYTKLVEKAQEKYDEKQKAVKDLQKTQDEQDKLVKDEANLVANQSAVIEQIQSGMKTPAEIFAALGGVVPFDVIKEITDTLPEDTTGEQFTLGRYDIRYDDAGNVIARGASAGGGGVASEDGDVSIGSIGLAPFGGASGLQTAEDKAFAGLDEAGQIASITRAMFGGNASDSDRKIVEKAVKTGKSLGLNRQQIIDRVIGFNPTNNSGLGEELKNILMSTATITGKSMSDYNPVGISDMLSNGRTSQAVQAVENTVYREAREAQPDAFISEANVKLSTTQVNELKKYLEEMRGKSTGIFDGEDLEDLPIGVTTGTMQDWLGRFRGEDATAIKTRVTEITAKMRNDLLGSAVTTSESAFLDPIIPNIYDNPSAFLDKLNRLSSTPLNRLNALRSTYGLPALDQKSLLNSEARTNLYSKAAEQSAQMRYKDSDNASLLGLPSTQSTDPNGIY